MSKIHIVECKILENIFTEDDVLLQHYDNASLRV